MLQPELNHDNDDLMWCKCKFILHSKINRPAVTFGSLLGPILFAAYISPVGQLITSHSVEHHLDAPWCWRHAVVPSHAGLRPVGIDYSCRSVNAQGMHPWRQTLIRRERPAQCRQVRGHDDRHSSSTWCCINSQHGRRHWRQLNVVVKT